MTGPFDGRELFTLVKRQARLECVQIVQAVLAKERTDMPVGEFHQSYFLFCHHKPKEKTKKKRGAEAPLLTHPSGEGQGSS